MTTLSATTRTGPVVRQRVFSGIQPTGTLHLGNYVGAVSLWVALQADHETILSIADLHTLTLPDARQAGRLQRQSRQTAATLLACGIDPDRATLLVQSHVRAHVELAWLLGCVTPIGWLQRMIQFKTRAATLESVGLGLLAYPVLQAADILLYRADLVPVGEDQQQHIELTREIVRRFHSLFGEVFTLPEVMLRPTGARIMSLDEPTVKMSKSLAETRSGHAIGLIDPPDAIRYAIMHAVTDSGREVRPEHASPGVATLLTIYQVLSGRDAAEVSADFAGKGYSELKRAVADLVIATLEPIRLQYLRLADAPETLDRVLAMGAERARLLAEQTLDQVQKLMGLDGSWANARQSS
jgi:tryptophanyl-tRNA synthetase